METMAAREKETGGENQAWQVEVREEEVVIMAYQIRKASSRWRGAVRCKQARPAEDVVYI